MAQNDLKPNHSSSSEEEEISGSEDEQASGSDSEDSGSDTDSGKKVKPTQPEPKKPLTATPQSVTKPQPDPSSSESEESGSDSDTDSDLPPKKSIAGDSAVKPTGSVPLERDESKTVKKTGSKTVVTPPPAKSKRPLPSPAAIEKDAKKLKQIPANGEMKWKMQVNKSKAPDLDRSESEESGSGSESGSETDTDSDSPPKKSVVSDPNVKTISSKPMDSKSAVKPISSKPMDSKSYKKTGSKMVPRPAGFGSGSDSDSDLPPKKSVVAEPNVKPVSSKPTNSKLVKKPGSKPVSTPAESGSESDTDSDLPPKMSIVANPNVKPVSSKPIESKSVKKAGSKTVTTPSPARSKSAVAPLKNEKLFQRLWSEDDEIVVLEGMIGYKKENGEDPIADMGAFHEYIKKSLHVDFSRSQLVDKVRRLKKKYVNNASREKDGKDRSFSKSHEQKAYELSKIIWGGNSNGNGNSNNNNSNVGVESKKKKNPIQKNGKLKGNAASAGTSASLLESNGADDKDKDKVMMDVEKNVDVSRFVSYVGMNVSPVVSEEIVKAGLELVEGSKRAELEAKWMKLKEEELELYVKRMELLKEQALIVLEAVRSSGN
ncbi:putative transcription factor GeBP family [Helianthus debilis subsp. tardiflorus]